MTESPLHIVHNTPGVGPTSFGLGQVPLNLANAQVGLGCDARVWCGSSVEDVRWAYASSSLREGHIERFPVVGPSRLGYSRSMARAAATAGRNVTIVHQHGIWTCGSRVTRTFHERHGIPYV